MTAAAERLGGLEVFFHLVELSFGLGLLVGVAERLGERVDVLGRTLAALHQGGGGLDLAHRQRLLDFLGAIAEHRHALPFLFADEAQGFVVIGIGLEKRGFVVADALHDRLHLLLLGQLLGDFFLALGQFVVTLAQLLLFPTQVLGRLVVELRRLGLDSGLLFFFPFTGELVQPLVERGVLAELFFQPGHLGLEFVAHLVHDVERDVGLAFIAGVIALFAGVIDFFVIRDGLQHFLIGGRVLSGVLGVDAGGKVFGGVGHGCPSVIR